jgi:hypothetical protein
MLLYKQHSRKLYLGLYLLALFGCAGNPQGAKFDSELLQEGGIIVVAVIPAQESDRNVRASLDDSLLLEQALRQQPGLKVRGAQQVVKALSPPMYAQLMNSFRFHGVAGGVYMDMIRNAMPGVRYLAYAWVKDDQTVHNSKPTETGLELRSTRAMTVALFIYDLDSRQAMVWAAALQEAATNRLHVMQQPYDVTDDMYPPAPKSAAVLNKLFPAMVKHLLAD